MKQIRPKRPLTAILVLVLAFCLIFIVACGNTETDPDDKNPDAPGDTVIPGDITTPDDGNDPDGGVTDDNEGNDGNEGITKVTTVTKVPAITAARTEKAIPKLLP